MWFWSWFQDPSSYFHHWHHCTSKQYQVEDVSATPVRKINVKQIVGRWKPSGHHSLLTWKLCGKALSMQNAEGRRVVESEGLVSMNKDPSFCTLTIFEGRALMAKPACPILHVGKLETKDTVVFEGSSSWKIRGLMRMRIMRRINICYEFCVKIGQDVL